MAMSPCDLCLNNTWKFEIIEKIVRASCQMCSNEVEFEVRKKKKDYSVCRDCQKQTQLQKCKFKPSKLNKPYYYTAYWKCSHCRKIYMDDQFKVLRSQ